jgi:hypothetical protein
MTHADLAGDWRVADQRWVVSAATANRSDALIDTYFLATGEQTGGAFCLVDEHASRGESVPR